MPKVSFQLDITSLKAQSIIKPKASDLRTCTHNHHYAPTSRYTRCTLYSVHAANFHQFAYSHFSSGAGYFVNFHTSYLPISVLSYFVGRRYFYGIFLEMFGQRRSGTDWHHFLGSVNDFSY